MSGIGILINVLCTAVVIVSLLLICLVLVQPSKSGGMGAAFGGIGQSVFGAQAGSHLTKLTVILTSVFFVLTLLLAFLVGHRADEQKLGAALAQRAEAQGEVVADTPLAETGESELDSAPVEEPAAE